MATDKGDLGRRKGVFVPVEDVQAHENAGWRIVLDALDVGGDAARVLMQPPAGWGRGEAA